MKTEIEQTVDILDDSLEVEIEVEEDERPDKMTDEEIVSFCLEELAKGKGGSQEGTNEYRTDNDAENYYFGRLPGLSETKARDPQASRFVSLDVQDAIEAAVAEIVPTFNINEIAFYVPDSEEDEESAKKESDLANYMFFHEYNGAVLLQALLRNALLKGNCTGKVFWEEKKVVRYETLENVNALAIEILLQKALNNENETIDIVEQEQHEAKTDDPAEPELFTIVIKRTTLVGKPVIESIRNNRITVSSDHESPVLYDAKFVAQHNIVTQSELIAQGFDREIVEQLNEYNYADEFNTNNKNTIDTVKNTASSDDSVRNISTHEIYALLDVDKDGIAERRKIVISDKTLLSNDPWNSVALVGGCVIAIPEEYTGLSLYDKLKDIQDSKTPVMRSIIDGTRLSSNPRIGIITPHVNVDDLMSSITGGTVRMTRADAVVPLPTGEVPASSYQLIEMMSNLRRERGGSAIDTAAVANSMDNSSESTVGRVMSAMELATALLVGTFAETIVKGLFVQLHEVLRENYKGKMSANIRGQWTTTVPSEWQERTAVTVTIGVSYAERQRQKAAMLEVVMYQEQLKAQGSVMYDEQKHYAAVAKVIQLSGIKNPEAYFIDPNSDEGKQKSEQMNQQSQEMQAKQSEMEAKMVKAQQDIADGERMKGEAQMISQKVKMENDFLKNQLTDMKQQLDANAKSIDQQLVNKKLDQEEALKLTELEAEHSRELSAQHEENKTNE